MSMKIKLIAASLLLAMLISLASCVEGPPVSGDASTSEEESTSDALTTAEVTTEAETTEADVTDAETSEITLPDVPTTEEVTTEARDTVEDHMRRALESILLSKLTMPEDRESRLITRELLSWIGEEYGPFSLIAAAVRLEQGEYTHECWHDFTGATLTVLNDIFMGALDPESENYNPSIRLIESKNDSTVLRFVGDMSFAENWYISPAMDQRGQGLAGVMDERIIELFQSADIMVVNNEFCYSNRGAPLRGKRYTFRAKPERAALLSELGVDVASLANNHAYDYGAEAFSDTLAALHGEGISTVGAGENIEEASKVAYFIVNGRKYAISAATRAEKNIITPAATAQSSGVMRTYDPTEYCKVIAEAERQADYNMVFVHWGREDSHYIETVLPKTAKQYIDAGADLIVGAHAHILQGIEYIGDVPVIYNLGDFLFDAVFVETGMLEVEIDPDGRMSCRFIACYEQSSGVWLAEGETKSDIIALMNRLSVNVRLDENGRITKK